MSTQTWLEDIDIPKIPEVQPVLERRREIQTLRDKRNAIVAERTKLEVAEKKAHVAVTDDPTVENFKAWVATREKVRAWTEAETLMQQMSTHYSDSLEGHNCGAEEILEPALKAIAEKVKAKIDTFTAEENKRLAEYGLPQAESAAIAPLKGYYEELNQALRSLYDWSGSNVQSAWRKFNHLIR